MSNTNLVPSTDIIISRKGDLITNIRVGDKYCGELGYDEAIGLIATLLVPESKGCLSWLRTQKENDHRKAWFQNMRNKRNPSYLAEDEIYNDVSKIARKIKTI